MATSEALARIRHVARDSGWRWAATLAADAALPLGLVRLWREVSVPAERLEAQCAAILASWGIPDDQVATCVASMVWADLHGIDSHGAGMLPTYHASLVAGHLNPRPRIVVLRENASTALLDGDGGLGHLAADRAVDLAIEKARASGVGIVAVRNSRHFGAGGAYAERAAARGLLALVTSTTPTAAVVPTRGASPLLGTNPITFAAPATRDAPFLLDMATSTVSRGKLDERWRRGEPIPRGWASDARGRPVTDGRAASRLRRLSPLGSDAERASHKGYGLAVMVEILSGLLPGVGEAAADGRASRTEVGHCFQVIDPAVFRAPDEFASGVDHLLRRLRAGPSLDPEQPVLVAGDPERDQLARRRAAGIPLSRVIVEQLRAVAVASGAPFLLGGGA